MRLSTRFVVVFTILFTGTASYADIVFAPAYTYDDNETETSGSTQKSNRTSLDLRLAYLDKSGLYLGAMYVMASTSSDSTDSKTTAIGPSLGFNANNGFFVIFTYFLTAQSKFSGSGPKLTDGMGPQVDLGWIFPLTESFFLGPQVSYRSIGYTKSETNGVSVSEDTTHTNIVPYVTVWYKF